VQQKKQKHDLERCFEDLKDFKYSATIFDRERDADILYLKEIAEICVKSEAFKAATATSKQNKGPNSDTKKKHRNVAK